MSKNKITHTLLTNTLIESIPYGKVYDTENNIVSFNDSIESDYQETIATYVLVQYDENNLIHGPYEFAIDGVHGYRKYEHGVMTDSHYSQPKGYKFFMGQGSHPYFPEVFIIYYNPEKKMYYDEYNGATMNRYGLLAQIIDCNFQSNLQKENYMRKILDHKDSFED